MANLGSLNTYILNTIPLNERAQSIPPSFFDGVAVQFEQSVIHSIAATTVIEFEQSVGVSFSGLAIEIEQQVRLRSTGGGDGLAAVEFSQQVIQNFEGLAFQISQMVVDDA